MKKDILFIHGGDHDGYEADTILVASLKKELGTAYTVHFPKMPDDPSQWANQIGKELSSIKHKVLLAGHSLGASLLLKFLSENTIKRNIDGIFLIAPPFWSGDQDWVLPLKLQKGFSNKLPKDVPTFLYQCKDDEVVPHDHFITYKKSIPWAVVREPEEGGHQFNNDLSIVATDIKSL
jgi:predicted alpha/beta hydrolase family esterase